MSALTRPRYNALIRTHHITSRKKVAKLRQAASHDKVYALLNSGGPPGIMYVEGMQTGVDDWVSAVQRLRYKDYQLVARTAEVDRETPVAGHELMDSTGLFETTSVKDFAVQMEQRGVLAWWRKAMGYSGSEDRL